MARKKGTPNRLPVSDKDVLERELVRNTEESQPANPSRKRRKIESSHPQLHLVSIETSVPEGYSVIAALTALQNEPEEASHLRSLASTLSSQHGIPGGLHLGWDSLALHRSNEGTDVVANSIAGVLHQSGFFLKFKGFFKLPHSVAKALLHLLKAKLLSLSLRRSDEEALQVLLAVSPAVCSSSQGAATRRSQSGNAYIDIIEWLLPEYSGRNTYPDVGSSASSLAESASSSQGLDSRDAAADIYAAVRSTTREPELQGNFPNLRVDLRPYQRRAAGWMVLRENDPFKMDRHPLWRELPVLDSFDLSPKKSMAYNPFCGSFTFQPVPTPAPVHGGILADEMGLGKTVEVLACIMANKYTGPEFLPPQKILIEGRPAVERVDCICGAVSEDPTRREEWVQCSNCLVWQHCDCVGWDGSQSGGYECMVCLKAQSAAAVQQQSCATLIVCPNPILHQWMTEIQKHVVPGSLKVLNYEGTKREFVSAVELASADIVLTTYSVLANDIYHQPDIDNERVHALRYPKRYEILSDADEAQLIENGTANAARLASKLQAKFRWAVTGTPINTGLQDLYGLLSFLKAEPYNDKHCWQSVCQTPYEEGCQAGRRRLIALLRPEFGGLLWRSSKRDLAGELKLPDQEHTLTYLEMSPVERHFYAQQHEWCYDRAKGILSRNHLSMMEGEADLDSPNARCQLPPQDSKALLLPLLRLRQACCHPQIGAGGIKHLQTRKKPMTMEEILAVLIAKAKNAAEEALRLLLFALNGLAAVAVINQDCASAINSYREVLKVVNVHMDYLKADSLQQLHAMHNLASLLGPNGALPSGVAPTLRDASLQKDADRIRERYMAQWYARLAAAEKDQKDALDQMDQASHIDDGAESALKDLAEGGSWYLEAVDFLQEVTVDGGEHIIRRIREQLADLNSDNTRVTKNAVSLSKRLKTAQSMKLVLFEELSLMEKARSETLAELAKLAEATSQLQPGFVEQAGQCGRCRVEVGQAGRVCSHCKFDELQMRWELRLFSLQAHALKKSHGAVTAEDAVRKAQQATLGRIGMGGLGESASHAQAEAGLAGNGPLGAEGAERRGDAGGVAHADVVHKASEAEQVLQLLIQQLRNIQKLAPAAAERRAQILRIGKAQLDRLEAMRKAFTKSRALSLAQRELLYAKDELEMCTMRMRLRYPGESVKPSEAHFKLHAAEVPIKQQELRGDRLTAGADVQRLLGTLRYLQGLQAARQEKDSPDKANQGNGGTANECPICHDQLAEEVIMLPCGHALCYQCGNKLDSQARRGSVKGGLSCPTCRQHAPASDITVVGPPKAEGSATGNGQGQLQDAEADIAVAGSYGTKVIGYSLHSIDCTQV